MKKAFVWWAFAAATVGTGVALTVAETTSASSATAPGTRVGGLPAGGLDRDALQALLARTTEKAAPTVTVVLGSRRTSLPVTTLGLTVDVAATVDKVLTDSGEGRRWIVLGQQQGRDVVPVLERDDTAFTATVASLRETAEVEEFHGDLRFGGGQLTVLPPADGQSTDEEAVEQALTSAAEQLPLPASVDVPITASPSHATAAEVDVVAATGRAVLERPLTLRAGTRSATVTVQALGGQLTVVPVGDSPEHTVALGLRSSAAAELAEPAARTLSFAAREPRIVAPVPTPMLGEKGDTQWTPVAARTALASPGSPGQSVDKTKVLEALVAVAQAGLAATEPVVVPAVVVSPKSSDAGARGVDSVLGTFTTGFACCQSRVTNIRLIARTLDETLIAPGESFSLNGLVGRRTRAKGYVEAPYILDGELSKDIGGGVSQFATTTLNAAFFAGVQLDKFQPHSFYIGRYPAGREATVNYPTIDLRWTNDTASPILLRTATTGTSVTVALYGRGDGRSVSAQSGARIPVRNRDFRITVNRILNRPGQPAQRRSFTTTYNPHPEEE